MTEQVSHGQGGGSLHRVFNSATSLHVQSIKNINIPVPTSCFMTTRLQPNVDYFLDSSTSSQLAALTELVQKQQKQLTQITQTLYAI